MNQQDPSNPVERAAAELRAILMDPSKLESEFRRLVSGIFPPTPTSESVSSVFEQASQQLHEAAETLAARVPEFSVGTPVNAEAVRSSLAPVVNQLQGVIELLTSQAPGVDRSVKAVQDSAAPIASHLQELAEALRNDPTSAVDRVVDQLTNILGDLGDRLSAAKNSVADAGTGLSSVVVPAAAEKSAAKKKPAAAKKSAAKKSAAKKKPAAAKKKPAAAKKSAAKKKPAAAKKSAAKKKPAAAKKSAAKKSAAKKKPATAKKSAPE